MLENLSNKEIACKLNISERTVKFRVSNLLAKFGVRRRADLILLCYQRPTCTGLDSPVTLSVESGRAIRSPFPFATAGEACRQKGEMFFTLGGDLEFHPQAIGHTQLSHSNLSS